MIVGQCLKLASYDLKKLGRKELLELLIEQGKEIDRLKEELAAADKRLCSRELTVDRAGSIAEAALSINKVFVSADNAARQYLENIKHWQDIQEQEYNRIIAEAKAEAEKIKADARSQNRDKTTEMPAERPTRQELKVDDSFEEILRKLENSDWLGQNK